LKGGLKREILSFILLNYALNVEEKEKKKRIRELMGVMQGIQKIIKSLKLSHIFGKISIHLL